MREIENVVLFLVDGMRPDGLQQADTPVMDGLIASGAHTLAGRTVMPSITLPCTTSLFLAVPPERHGITTNTWMPPERPVPGLIDAVHQAGGRTASFYNWEQLRDLSRPGSLAASFFLANSEESGGAGDLALAQLAADWLGGNEVRFAFVYLGHTDAAGHAHGWMSRPYIEAIAGADRCIGEVMGALDDRGVVIVTSDHGGHDRCHGSDCEEDMTIPFIVSHHPSVPAACTIGAKVHITDIAPTVATLLGVPCPGEWVGKPVRFA